MSRKQPEIDYAVGQMLSIKLHSKCAVEGLFYCFDPETQSIIMEDANAQLMWINGHDIKQIENLSMESESSPQQKHTLQSKIIDQMESLANGMLNEDPNDSHQELSAETKEIQSKLMDYLSEHQLSPELTKTKVIKIGKILSITPPYDQNCCRSTNEIVLSTVLNLLDQFYSEIRNVKSAQRKEQSDSDDVLDID